MENNNITATNIQHFLQTLWSIPVRDSATPLYRSRILKFIWRHRRLPSAANLYYFRKVAIESITAAERAEKVRKQREQEQYEQLMGPPAPRNDVQFIEKARKYLADHERTVRRKNTTYPEVSYGKQ